ncbi:hypothetical protein BDW74DRAFT_114206 [Aspergillus multicolor]|uniref:uncharacterized protein n=1 Tax=Aspergillus multicolor TaxID=41759 RepID=UPI003CCE0CFB
MSVLRSPSDVAWSALPLSCFVLSSVPGNFLTAPANSLSSEPDLGVVVFLVPVLVPVFDPAPSDVGSDHRTYGSEPAHHCCVFDGC